MPCDPRVFGKGQRPPRLPSSRILADTLFQRHIHSPIADEPPLPSRCPSPYNLRPPRRLKNLPLTLQALALPARLLQDPDNPRRNLLKVARREREYGGARAREAAAQEAGLRAGRHGGDDLAEAGDQGAAVGLVELVLHGEVDEFRVGGRLAEGDREEGYPLEVEGLPAGSVFVSIAGGNTWHRYGTRLGVGCRGTQGLRGSGFGKTYNVRPAIVLRQHRPRVVRRDDKVRDDGYRLDLLGPGERDAVADAVGRARGHLASIDTAGRLRKDLAEGDLDARDVLGLQRLEVGADEAAEEGGADVVGVSLWGEGKLALLAAEERGGQGVGGGAGTGRGEDIPIMRQ